MKSTWPQPSLSNLKAPPFTKKNAGSRNPHIVKVDLKMATMDCIVLTENAAKVTDHCREKALLERQKTGSDDSEQRSTKCMMEKRSREQDT